MLSIAEIKALIDSDSKSDRKRFARVARRYYDGDHDIRRYRIFFVGNDGKVHEDKTKNNAKICRPFFAELVDQGAQYFLSGAEEIVKSDDPELQKRLNPYFNNGAFRRQLHDMLVSCEIDGDAYAYAYKRKDGRTAFMHAQSGGVVEVRESESDDGCEYVIYWYVERIGKEGKTIKRIQVWDSKQTFFYCQEGDGEIVPDASETINPCPHITYKKDGDDATYAQDYGQIPFFRMDNNRKRRSSLWRVKGHIDDYDLMNCGLTNAIQDAVDYIVVVRGYDGTDLDELIHNMRTKKQISTDGPDDNVEIRTIDIPVEARVKKMEIDVVNIYSDGRGVNIEALRDSNATVSVAIKTAYFRLDMRCDEKKTQVEELMEMLVQVALDEINEKYGEKYTLSDVYFDFSRRSIVNELEMAQAALTRSQARQAEIMTLLNLEMKLDGETLMQLVCDQLEIDYEEIRNKLPAPQADDPYNPGAAIGALTEIVTEDDGGDGLD